MIKNKLHGILGYLGIKATGLVKLILIFTYNFPRLFIAVAKWSGQSKAIMDRTWNIHGGPLNGYRLFNLLLPEIVPVLQNRMETRCSDLLLKLDLKSAVVFDVGASYGYYTLLLSRLVDVGTVYSFEPDWRSYGRLVQNLVINAVENVVPVPVCISNSQPTLLRWNSRQDDPWNSGIAVGQKTDTQNSIAVPVISLDKFSHVLNIQNCLRFIKIDVEGKELEVLEGATHMLDSAQPLILCELHSSEVAQQVYEFLLARHYEWEMVEYMSETRQHILAFPASQSANYRSMIAK